MYILLCGSPPFNGSCTATVLDAVRKDEPRFEEEEWQQVSPEGQDLLKSLVVRDPRLRITAADALQHRRISQVIGSLQGDAVVTNSVVHNLKSFSTMNKLKKAALNVVARQMSDSAA